MNIAFKRTEDAAFTPNATMLAVGELFLNIKTKKLYSIDNNSDIVNMTPMIDNRITILPVHEGYGYDGAHPVTLPNGIQWTDFDYIEIFGCSSAGACFIPNDDCIHKLKVVVITTTNPQIDRLGKRENGSETYIDFPILNISITAKDANSNRFYALDDGYSSTGIVKDSLGNANAILHNQDPDSWGRYSESGILFRNHWTDNEGTPNGDVTNRAGIISTPEGIVIFHHKYDGSLTDIDTGPSLVINDEATIAKNRLFEKNSRVWSSESMLAPACWISAGLNSTMELTVGSPAFLYYLNAEYNGNMGGQVLSNNMSYNITELTTRYSGTVLLFIKLKFWCDNNVDDNHIFRLEYKDVSKGITNWITIAYCAGYVNNDDGEVSDIIFNITYNVTSSSRFRVIYDTGSTGLRQASSTVTASLFGYTW